MGARASLLLVVAAALLAAARAPSSAQDRAQIFALVHRDNPATRLSEAELRAFFLGSTRFWEDGTPVQAFDRPPESAAGRAFLRTIGYTPSRFRHHWQEAQLAGRGRAPRTVGPPRQVIERVAGARGGIGILAADERAQASGARVKVVPIR